MVRSKGDGVGVGRCSRQAQQERLTGQPLVGTKQGPRTLQAPEILSPRHKHISALVPVLAVPKCMRDRHRYPNTCSQPEQSLYEVWLVA